MTLRTSILPALDAIRAIPGRLGLRVWQVSVVVRTWGGPRPGMGVKRDVTTPLTNQGLDGVAQNVRVRQLSRREVMNSGGLYSDRDIRVGPVTPPYSAAFQMAAGGQDDTLMAGKPTGAAVEVFWIVSAPQGTFGYPVGGTIFAPPGSVGINLPGALFSKVGEEATSLHTYVILRAVGGPPPL